MFLLIGVCQGNQGSLSSAKSYHVGVASTDDECGNNGYGRIGDLITQISDPSSSQSMCGPFAGAKLVSNVLAPWFVAWHGAMVGRIFGAF